MVCRRQRNRKIGIARLFRERIQAVAKIFGKTSSPFPRLSPANRCDRSNAFSFCDSQRHRQAIQSLVIAKVGRPVPCAPIAIKNLGAHRVTRPTTDASQTKTDGDLIQRRSAPESVSAFVTWLPATTSGRSLAPYPTRNVPASSAHWGFAG